MFYIVVITLAVFLIASVIYQITSLKPKIGKYDKLGILPNYSFFAPKPLTRDYRLAYKVIADEEQQEWIEIPFYNKFSILQTVWNPRKYYNKGMIDTCNFMIKEFEAVDNKRFIQVSMHYINILLTIAMFHKAPEKNNTKIRFAVLTSEGNRSASIETVLFASYHQII